ncbi:hypothetical protein ACWFNS_07425 [Oerskovia enterophila]
MTERELADNRDSMSLVERVQARLEIDIDGADYGELGSKQLERLAEVFTVDDEFSSSLHRISDRKEGDDGRQS